MSTITSPTTITEIALDHLHPDEANVRRSLGDLKDLTRSVKGVGIVEPLIVTPDDTLPDGEYRIVAGHRRHAAAREAGLAEVPCVIRSMSATERLAAQLVENLRHSDLRPLDEAIGYLRLCQLDFSVRKLAQTVGRSEKHVRGRLALLDLPESAQTLLDTGEITLGDAEVLLDAKDRPEVIDQVLADEANRHRIESALRNAVRQAEHADRRTALVAELEEAGARVLGDDVGGTPVGDLGIDETDHASEPCHAIVILDGYAGPQAMAVCTERQRHAKRGESEVKTERKAPRSDPDAEAAKERRRLAARRSDFVDSVIGGRLHKAVTTHFALQVLVDRANSNECGRACRSLGIDAGSSQWGGPDWVSPLVSFAGESETNLLRAGAAVAVAMAEARITPNGSPGLAVREYGDWLLHLGYEPEAHEDLATTAG